MRKLFCCLAITVLSLYGCSAEDHSVSVVGADPQNTDGDTIAPFVASTSPRNHRRYIPIGTKVIAVFSEPIDPATISDSVFNLGENVTGTVTCDSNIAVFTPDTLLARDTTYQAVILPEVRDLIGNEMTRPYTWKFTTTAGPGITRTQPEYGDSELSPVISVSVIFDTDMDPASITPSSFYLAGGPTGTISYDSRMAVLTPDDSLEWNTTYTAVVTADVCDTNGTTMAVTYSWIFSTGVRPEVISFSPADGETAVTPYDSVKVTFSKDMDPATITENTFLITPPLDGTLHYHDRVATFVPDDFLLFGINYTVTLTPDISDTSGFPLASGCSWSFSTFDFEEIMPLAVGNWWAYHVERWDTDRYKTYDGYDTVRITESFDIDGETWYRVNSDGWAYANRPDGLWRKEGSEPPRLYLEYPAKVGDCYEYYYYAHYNVTFFMEVLSINYDVSVDAGAFTCHRYKSFYDDIIWVDWLLYYTPGIGLVLWDEFYRDMWDHYWGVRTGKRTLVDYYIQQ